MQRNRLTDAKVRGAKPRETPYKLSDGSGLFLRVAPNGTAGGARTWRFRYWLDGKERGLTLGTYPEVTLAEARTKLEAARAQLSTGINPAEARQEERRRNREESAARQRDAEGAFAKVAAAWLDAGKSEWAAGTYRAKRARVERHLLPALAALPIKRIGPNDIRPILVACESAGAWAAVHVKGDLAAIFGFAIARGLCDANPIPTLRGLVKIPQSQSKAVLSRGQIHDFFVRLRAYRGFPETSACLRLIALTACRPGEAANAEWSEFDLEAKVWRRPAAKMKSRRDHVSPLSPEAIALLDELRPVTGAGRYLFPKRDGSSHTTTERLTYAMRDLALGKGASPHCWRTTFSTWANERGFRPDAIERQLAHVEGNKVRSAYNKALLIDERREMMRIWAEYLSAAAADNVVALPVSRSAG